MTRTPGRKASERIDSTVTSATSGCGEDSPTRARLPISVTDMTSTARRLWAEVSCSAPLGSRLISQGKTRAATGPRIGSVLCSTPPPSSSTCVSPSVPGCAVPLRTTEPAKSATKALAGRADSSAGVPRCTMRPASMTKISSASMAASEKSCVTTIASAGVPLSAWTSSRPACARVRVSRAVRGSSRSRTLGSRASDRASATRWRSPPEREVGRASASPSTPKRWSCSTARFRRFWRGPGIPKATFFQALRCGNRA